MKQTWNLVRLKVLINPTVKGDNNVVRELRQMLACNHAIEFPVYNKPEVTGAETSPMLETVAFPSWGDSVVTVVVEVELGDTDVSVPKYNWSRQKWQQQSYVNFWCITTYFLKSSVLISS